MQGYFIKSQIKSIAGAQIETLHICINVKPIANSGFPSWIIGT